MYKSIVICCLLLFTSACSLSHKVANLGEDSNVDPTYFPKQYTEKKFSLESERIAKLLELGQSTNSIRMVEVFKPKKPFPTYYLFDIKPGSIYDALGLKNKDELISVEDFAVFEEDKFVKYIALLPKLDSTFMRLRRDGRDYLFAYAIES